VNVQASFDELPCDRPEAGRRACADPATFADRIRKAMQFGIIVWEVPRKRCPPTYSGKGLMPYQDLEAATLPSTRSTRP